MPPIDRSLPEGRAVLDWLARARGTLGRAPLALKVIAVIAAIVFFPAVFPLSLLAGLLYAPVALITERRSALASVSVAIWGWLVVTLAAGGMSSGLMVLFALSLAVAAAAHQGVLGRCYVPCRTTAWALLWSMPAGGLALRLWPVHAYIGVAAALLLACLVLGWRLAKSWQEVRGYGHGRVRATALAAPHADTARTARLLAERPDQRDQRRQPAPV